MPEKLKLREDERIKDARWAKDAPSFWQATRAAFLYAPPLVGLMYLLMRRLPEDAFPPYFWTKALLLPSAGLIASFGLIGLMHSRLRRTCTLSAGGIYLGAPVNQGSPWRYVTAWQVESSHEHPGYIAMAVRVRGRPRPLEMIVLDGPIREQLRAFLLHHAPEASRPPTAATRAGAFRGTG